MAFMTPFDKDDKKLKLMDQISTNSKSSGTDAQALNQVQQAASSIKLNAYQQVVSQPVNDKWYKGDQPTGLEILGQAAKISMEDPSYGRRIFNQFNLDQSNPESPYYWPYKTATNRSISAIGETGIDVSGGINSDWLQQNSGLQNYYQFGDTTNTPQKLSKPGKKATQDQIAAYNQGMSAYYYYQIANDEQQTVNAETEWEAMQHELAYWAGRDDLNMSDDEIVEKVHGEMKTKYPTLYKMDQSVQTGGTVMSFNRPIGYSPDNMYGVLWAYRNDGGTGNSEADTALGAAGEGNQWQENTMVRGARDPQSGLYAPYTTGMVGLDDEGLLFGQNTFNQQWLDDNRSMIMSPDQTVQRAYARVAEAEEFTQAAEAELDTLYQDIDTRLPFYADDPDALIDLIYSGSDYSHLQAMDRGAKTGNFKNTTRAIGYSREGVEDYIRKQSATHKEQRPPQQAVSDTLAILGGKVAGAIQAAASPEDGTSPEANNLAQAGPVIFNYGNQYERGAFVYGGDQVQQNAEALASTQIESDEQLDNTVSASLSSMLPRLQQNYAADLETLGNYQGLQNNLNVKQERLSYLNSYLSVFGDNLTEEQAGVMAEYAGERDQLEAEIPEIEAQISAQQGAYNEASARQLSAADVYSYMNRMMPEGQSDEQQQSATEQIDNLVREANGQQASIDEMTSMVLGGEIDYGTWLGLNGRGNYSQLISNENVRSISRNIEANRRNGTYNDRDDVSLMDSNGLFAHHDKWAGKLAVAEEAVERLNGIINGRNSTDILLNLNAAVHNERTIISGEGYDESQKFVARDRLETLLAEQYDGYNEIVGKVSILVPYLQNSANVPIEERRARAYDIMNGDGAYERAISTKNEQERAAFDEYIDRVIYEGYDCTTALRAAESEVRYAQDQLEQNENQRRWNNEYDELMEWYGAETKDGDPSFIPGNVRWDPAWDDSSRGYKAARQADRIYALANGQGYDANEVWSGNDRNAFLMTDDEVAVFNALYNSGRYDDAERFYGKIQRELNQRGHFFEEISTRAIAREMPILSSLMSAVGTALQPAEFVYNLMNLGAYYAGNLLGVNISNYDPKDAYNSTTAITRYKNTSRAAVTEDLGAIGKYVYAPLMSGVDSAITMWMAGGAASATQGRTLRLFFTQSFQNEYQRMLAETNGDVLRSFWGATIKSGIEAFTEIASFEAFMSDPKKIFQYLAKNAVAEGSEELVGSVFGPVIEAAAGLGNQWQERADAIYNAGGYKNKNGEWVEVKNYDDAVLIATNEWTEDIAYSTLSGAISTGGGIFRAAGYSIQGRQAERARVHDIAVLDGMHGSNADVATGLTGILYNGIGDGNAAQASAQSLMEICGDGATATNLVNELTLATRGNENLYMKNTLGYASLTNGTARETLDGMVDNLRNGGRITMEDVQSLMDAVEADQQGENSEELQQQYEHAVRETRIANKVASAGVAGAFANASLEIAAAQQAMRNQRTAEENAETAQERVNAVSENLGSVEQNYNPNIRETAGPLQQTTNELCGAIEQRDQANQQAYQAKHLAKDAQKKAETAANDAIYQARHAARQEIVQEDISEVTRGAEEVETAISEAETEATAETVTDQEETTAETTEVVPAEQTEKEEQQEGNASVAETDPRIAALKQKLADAKQQLDVAVKNNDGSDQALENVEQAVSNMRNVVNEVRTGVSQVSQDMTNEREGGQERTAAEMSEQAIRSYLMNRGYSGDVLERNVAKVMGRRSDIQKGKVNTKARLSEKDGERFLRSVSRMTGIGISMADLGDPLTTRGYIIDKNNIVLNSNLTRGQAVVEAALHEVTHGLEEMDAYKKYSDFVLNAMYGGTDTEAYQKALKEKIDEYNTRGKKLTPETAQYELVADYARHNLATKKFARGIVAHGIGGKLRAAIQNAIATLKGFTLDAEGRAEYKRLRTAARLLNEAMQERAQKIKEGYNGHTGIVQASITGWTDATGLTLEVDENGNSGYKLYKDGKLIEPGQYTAEMVKGTPIGNLIDMAAESRRTVLDNQLNRGSISKANYNKAIKALNATSEQQRQYISQIINMIGQYQDAAMVWELSGSLAFSCLKSNGDPQYSDSYDFGTICTKTQAILNAISQTQVDLGRALTKEEIDGIVYYEVGMGVQDENGNWKHGATPCPPCYVYATWVNKPARLEKVRLYQEECADWTNEQINEFMNSEMPVGKTKSETTELQTEYKSKKLWISTCLANQVTDSQTGEKTWVRKENPDICPNEILLDLRRSGDMAVQYPGTWTFMQKGGNAQGKAIAPYSDARLGESIVAKAIGSGEANKRLLEDERNAENQDYIPQFLNPFMSVDSKDQKKAKEYFEKAIKKVRAQNLKGGQRWQSWSDFRAEWGSDYLMEMITMQALGSQVQTYTKVSEAIDLLASAGFEVNMSLMPYGDGFWHNEDGSIKIDEDGNMMLRFSPVTGINPDAAEGFAKKYGTKGNVQPMVVGISDEHIMAALAGDYITFVIPFHGSGGSVSRLQHLMSLLKEQMETGNDYTRAQSDKFESGEKNTNPNWSLRNAILTGNYASLSESQRDAIDDNPFLRKLYEERYLNEDSEAFEVFFAEDEAQQIYPYEYWDTNTTLATADVNSRRFIEYCQMLGVIPRFSGLEKTEGKGKNAHKVEYANFSGRHVDETGNVTYEPVKGYWKLLIDRSMYKRVYDENGKIIPEKCTYHKPSAVSTADIDVGQMPKAANNTIGHSDDDTREITRRIIQRIEMTSGQNEAAGSAVDLQQNRQTLQEAMYEGSDVQLSSGGDLTEAEADDIINRSMDSKYMDAVENGNAEAQQEMVDDAAERAGYTIKVYHGTPNSGRFNVFDPLKLSNSKLSSQIGQGFYFTNSKSGAEEYTRQHDIYGNTKAGKNPYLFEGYLRLQNPIELTEDSHNLSYETIRSIVEDGDNQWFFNSGMLSELSGIEIDGKRYTRDELSRMDRGEVIDLYVKDLMRHGDKYTLQHLVDTFKFDHQGQLLESMKKHTGADGIHWNMKEGLDQFVAFDSSQFKDSAPVTYDDNGNVIPLSERFSDSPDIRYSYSGVISDTEADQILASIGSESITDRVARQNTQANDALNAISGWTDGKPKSVSEVDSILGNSKYSTLHQWIHNTYEKNISRSQKGKQIIYKDDIANFILKDNDRIQDGISSVAKGWANIASKHKTIKAVQTSNNNVTKGNVNAKTKAVISALFNGSKGNYYVNKDTGATIFLDNESIQETFSHTRKKSLDSTERILYSADTLLENSIYIGDHINYAHPNTKVHYFASAVNDAGDNKTVIFAVHDPYNNDQARKFSAHVYVAEVKVINNKKGAVNSLNAGKSQTTQALRRATPFKVSISDVLDIVNTDRIRSFDKKALKNQSVQNSFLGDLSDNDADMILYDLGMVDKKDVPYSNLPARPSGTAFAFGSGPQRQFGHQTSQESNAIHQQVKDYLYSHSDYTPESNSEQIDRAINWLRNYTGNTQEERFYNAMREATSNNFNSTSADGQAKMLTLMSYAAATGNIAAETDLAMAYNEQGTRLGQALQARKIFRLMTPLGRESVVLKMQQRINEQYEREGSDVRVELSPEIVRAAGEAKTEEEFARVRKAATRNLAQQMPPDWKGRMRTWRMMSMLLNPRTHVRNIVGNWGFKYVVSAKNAIGTGLEHALIRDGGQRTKSIIRDRQAVAFAKEDFDVMSSVLSGESKYGPDTQIDMERKYFGQKDTLISKTLGRLIQWGADANSRWLEKEDMIFLKGHYVRALSGWMTANHMTEADMANNPQALQTAREYAIREAQKATYRDANELASALSKLGRREDALGFIVNAALPFKKTPANILRRGIEYSPVGLIQSLVTAKRSLNKYAIWEQNGFKGQAPKGARSATEVIDRVAAGMTGTMVAALGAFLKSIGAVELKLGDKPDDELEKLEGKQEYSLNLFGYNVTLDWAAPVCMPFFFGASVMDWADEAGSGEASLSSFLDSILGMTEPVFNLSMLDGINSLLRTSSYSSGNVPLGEIGLKLLTNYASSYVPSALGAAARTIDTTRRRTYTESGAGMIWGKVNGMLEQMQNKIPYLSMENSPYRNSLGEPDVTEQWLAALENFVLPGYINKVQPTVITEELGRIYDQTGDAGVIPKSMAGTKTIKIDGETIRLTDHQNDAYQDAYGTAVRDTLTAMFGMPEFVALTDVNPDAQAALVGDVMTYAKSVAKYALFPDAAPATGWVRGAMESDNPAEFIIQRAESDAREQTATEFRNGAATAIQGGDFETAATSVAGMKEAGWSDKKIRGYLMNDIGPVYKQAYLDGDVETMTSIENTLPMLDLGQSSFKKSTFKTWQRNARTNIEEETDEDNE